MGDLITSASSGSLWVTALGVFGALMLAVVGPWAKRRFQTTRPATEPHQVTVEPEHADAMRTMAYVVEKYEDRLSRVEAEKAELQQQLDTTEAAVAEREQRITRLEQELRDARAQMAAYQQSLSTSNAQIQEQSERAERLMRELQGLRSQ